jgi:hypothetical protein
MASAIRPTGQAGEFAIPGIGKTIKLVQWREGDIYDTVLLATAAGAVTAGSEFQLFRDIQGKDKQHTNLKTPRRLPSDSELIVSRIGLHINQAIANIAISDLDVIKIAHNLVFSFKVGERLVAEGPVLTFQSGYGVTGSTTRNNTGVVTVGVASAAAAPQLLVAQPIDDSKDLDAVFRFPPATWLTTAGLAAAVPSLDSAAAASCYLHGFIKRPHGE